MKSNFVQKIFMEKYNKMKTRMFMASIYAFLVMSPISLNASLFASEDSDSEVSAITTPGGYLWRDITTKPDGITPSLCELDIPRCVIRDESTGRKWALSPTNIVSWGAASDYCDQLDKNGEQNWRLASLNELSLARKHEIAASHELLLQLTNDGPPNDNYFWSSIINSDGGRAFFLNYGTDTWENAFPGFSWARALCVN